MIELEPCPECGTPGFIAKEHSWLDNGDIVQNREIWHRMVFLESENLDPLFHGVEELLGKSIEHIIITVQRRAVRSYLAQFVSEAVRELVSAKRIQLRILAEAAADIARIMGFGNYQFQDMRFEHDDDDFYTADITEPFSLPMAAAALAADIEMLTGRDQGVKYETMSPGAYRITSFPSPHPGELKSKMLLRYYYPESGDIELRRCATCRVPKGLSKFRWRLERGVIENTVTGKYMTIIGWQNLEPIFNELVAEFGKDIERLIVEAQKRFTKSGFFSTEDTRDPVRFRSQLALRGMGNLRELNVKPEGSRLRLENAALPLMVVGLAQGLFEMTYGVESNVEWELSGEGNLEVEVTPHARG